MLRDTRYIMFGPGVRTMPRATAAIPAIAPRRTTSNTCDHKASVTNRPGACDHVLPDVRSTPHLHAARRRLPSAGQTLHVFHAGDLAGVTQRLDRQFAAGYGVHRAVMGQQEEAVERSQERPVMGDDNDGAGKVAVHKTLTLLGSILQRAVEGEHIQTNPARAVKHTKRPKRSETVPLAPVTVEALRAAMLDPVPPQIAGSANGQRNRRAYSAAASGTAQSHLRDATLLSVLAYAGLRPQEALALTWGDVGERTIRVYAPKTNTSRSVRLSASLAADLREFRMASGRPAATALIFPDQNGDIWPKATWDNWRTRNFSRALAAAEIDHRRPYDLRHSFASLLLHEGRNVIYVARQLGHGAQLTLSTYGHVIEELDGAPQMDAETAIQAARSDSAAHQLPMAGSGSSA
jgi:site-specific recombinase XerD